MRPNYSLTSEATTTTGTSDSSPRTPKSTEQLLAVYHSVPETLPVELKTNHLQLDKNLSEKKVVHFRKSRSLHSVLEMGGVGTSHTTSTLGTSSDDVFQEEDEEEEEEEEQQQEAEEEGKARLIV
nr:phospholipid phosphatase-related protein type 3-like [Penaeus vannamei]